MITITYNPETHRLVPVDMLDDARVIFCSDSEPNTNGDCSDVIEWFKASIYAAPQPEPVVIGSPLTERKAQSVIDRGYKITGYTLTNEQGQKCIVDMSAVRWFDDGDKFFRIMHPQPEPVEVEPSNDPRESFEKYASIRGMSIERTSDSYKTQATKSAWRAWSYLHKTVINRAKQTVEVEPVAYADSYGNVITKATKDFSRNVMTNSYSRALYTAPPDYEAVKKQRDELAKVIETAYEVASEHDDSLPFDWAVYCEMLHKALASVKGGAA